METKKRAIDANELLKYVGNKLGFMISKRELLQAIELQPTMDVVEVVHGRWEPIPGNNTYERCSVCKDTYIHADWIGGDKWYYCPNCGAKLEAH